MLVGKIYYRPMILNSFLVVQTVKNLPACRRPGFNP